MKESNIKYPEAVIKDLSSVFASKDSNSASYLTGPKLTTMFKSLGFADSYQFPNIGITTPEESGLSRIQYAYKRLSDLNDQYRLPEAIRAFQRFTNDITQVTEVFNSYKIELPIQITSPQPALISSLVGDMKMSSAVEHDFQSMNVKSDDQKLTKGEIDSVFDEIPPGAKVAFISYSWENDESHQQWVLKLADDLNRMGVFVLLDQYLLEGYSLTHFMDKGLDVADKVIVIGTPTYKDKSINASQGGVAYEGAIIKAGLFAYLPTTKVIPVCRKGSFAESFPPLIGNRSGFDFSDDNKYSSLLSELVRAICDVPKHARPKLGQLPKFDYEDLSETEREMLKCPQSDFRKTQDRKIVEKLFYNFSFPLMNTFLTDYPTQADLRVFMSLDIWNSIIGSSTFRIYDPKLNELILSFHDKWVESERIGYKYYSTIPGQNEVRFYGLQNDSFVNEDAELAFNRIIVIHQEMLPILKDMASYVMDNFEIDLDESSNRFIEYLDKN
ncbi:MAG: toll/interleukin-1 receptor domain-containing protein [Muribaculum sp.]|nr:toll/interleukin-1 receptor domain-containing protein [Muribaculum sp.]